MWLYQRFLKVVEVEPIYLMDVFLLQDLPMAATSQYPVEHAHDEMSIVK